MKIIDFHTHFFPNDLAPRAIARLIENAMPTITMKNHTDGTIDGLLDSMRKGGIDISVTLGVATKPSQVATINRGCAENKYKYPEIIQFGTLHPEMEDFGKEIDYLVDNGIRGIKMHPEYQYFYVDAPKYFPIYEKLSAAGMIVVMHSGKDPGPFTNDHVLPPAILNIHKNFPELKLVAAHMGGWMVWEEALETLAGTGVYFDTSAICRLIPKELFLRMCRKHGCEKIIFGSDSPWYGQEESVDWVKHSGLNSAELEAIFYNNAAEILF